MSKIVFTVPLLILIFFCTPSHGARLPIEDFLKSGDYLDVTLSPSGAYLAARVYDDERTLAVIIDRKTGKSVGGIDPGSGNKIHSITGSQTNAFSTRYQRSVKILIDQLQQAKYSA